MTDGNLRQLIQKHIPHVHWQAIETGRTGRGIPDLNYCNNGIEGWIECKQTSGWKVQVQAEQVAWIERRIRNGGRVYIAVRRKAPSGPRRGPPVDEFMLFNGSLARELKNGPVKHFLALVYGHGGPSHWPWAGIEQTLLKET